jgi:pyruvate/2-oxoglutarate dehydrogenase complex dihydrolipoamide acyltransferase (E2) component
VQLGGKTDWFLQARDNKLTIEDMAGGTFTISNVKNLGILQSQE